MARFFDATRGHVLISGPRTRLLDPGSPTGTARSSRSARAWPRRTCWPRSDRVIYVGGGPAVWTATRPTSTGTSRGSLRWPGRPLLRSSWSWPGRLLEETPGSSARGARGPVLAGRGLAHRLELDPEPLQLVAGVAVAEERPARPRHDDGVRPVRDRLHAPQTRRPLRRRAPRPRSGCTRSARSPGRKCSPPARASLEVGAPRERERERDERARDTRPIWSIACEIASPAALPPTTRSLPRRPCDPRQPRAARRRSRRGPRPCGRASAPLSASAAMGAVRPAPRAPCSMTRPAACSAAARRPPRRSTGQCCGTVAVPRVRRASGRITERAHLAEPLLVEPALGDAALDGPAVGAELVASHVLVRALVVKNEYAHVLGVLLQHRGLRMTMPGADMPSIRILRSTMLRARPHRRLSSELEAAVAIDGLRWPTTRGASPGTRAQATRAAATSDRRLRRMTGSPADPLPEALQPVIGRAFAPELGRSAPLRVERRGSAARRSLLRRGRAPSARPEVVAALASCTYAARTTV